MFQNVGNLRSEVYPIDGVPSQHESGIGAAPPASDRGE